jgi:hypothetical protein
MLRMVTVLSGFQPSTSKKCETMRLPVSSSRTERAIYAGGDVEHQEGATC